MITMNRLKRDEYIKHVADTLVKEMEKSGTNFIMPFIEDGMPIKLSKVGQKNPYYRGGNVWWLNLNKRCYKYKTNVWGTAKQIKDKGGEILEKEKSKATQVYFYKPYDYETTAKRNSANHKKGDKKTASAVYMAFFWVYNMSQTTLANKYLKLGDGAKTDQEVEKYVNNTCAIIEDGHDQCFYSPSRDIIGMVDKKFFNKTGTSNATENYYSTLLHELTHWTAHKDRCNRDLSGRFGDSAYAFEELVAEFGAALQCCLLGITNKPKKESAQYLKSWISKIKDDPKALFKAMSLADKAVAFIEKQQEEVKIAA